MERFVLEVYCDKKADAEQLDGAPADTDDREVGGEGGRGGRVEGGARKERDR